MNIAVSILQIVFIVFFSIAGAMKVLGHTHMRDEFDNFGYPHWLMRVAGTLELIATPLLIVGFWQPIYAAFGASLLTAVMIGACYTNFTQRPAAYGWGTMVLALLCAALAAHFSMLADF
ncbi:DoxX family protein [Zhongshania arctica]|uniref:DoxX family protein n=1 Tax=Zhongshania arctica TaxID=3238302 RepID=A0ABV3TWC4_9GAMM